jgi:hypothetical protein
MEAALQPIDDCPNPKQAISVCCPTKPKMKSRDRQAPSAFSGDVGTASLVLRLGDFLGLRAFSLSSLIAISAGPGEAPCPQQCQHQKTFLVDFRRMLGRLQTKQRVQGVVLSLLPPDRCVDDVISSTFNVLPTTAGQPQGNEQNQVCAPSTLTHNHLTPTITPSPSSVSTFQ